MKLPQLAAVMDYLHTMQVLQHSLVAGHPELVKHTSLKTSQTNSIFQSGCMSLGNFVVDSIICGLFCIYKEHTETEV